MEYLPQIKEPLLVEPLYVQVHARDNVAIIVIPEGLPAGTTFQNGLALAEAIRT